MPYMAYVRSTDCTCTTLSTEEKWGHACTVDTYTYAILFLTRNHRAGTLFAPSLIPCTNIFTICNLVNLPLMNFSPFNLIAHNLNEIPVRIG